MGPAWDRQVGPMLTTWNLLSESSYWQFEHNRRHFADDKIQMQFIEWNRDILFKCYWKLLLVSNWYEVSLIGSGNALVPNGRQAIIQISAD